LPENEEPAASAAAESKAGEAEPEALDLDLSGYQPAGEEPADTPATAQDDELELGTVPGPEEESADESSRGADEASAGESEADIDTRVSLAEAFLDVGDRESFDMIEAELREEGATAALQRLDELKQRYES
jgi:hypothetical protein